jgi:hypothetical protein
MTPLIAFLLGAALVVLLTILRSRYLSFRAQSPADFTGRGPDFDIRRHLSGPILCEGVIYGPTGRVTSRFVADMVGEWDGNRGILREHFRYDTGRRQDRAWTLELAAGGLIRASAPDIVGTGSGLVAGPAVQMRYRIRLDAEAGGHVLDVTDWMYLMDNGTIMNRSQFRKFGLTVAELVATMRPAQIAERRTAGKEAA